MAPHLISRYASENNRPVIRWKEEVSFREKKKTMQDYLQHHGGVDDGNECVRIMYEMNPQLYSYFCQGYEVILTKKNMKPEIGIVNGSRGILMDLSWSDDVREKALLYIQENSDKDVIELPREFVPKAVIVRVILSEGHLKNCTPDKSLSGWNEDTPVGDRKILVPVTPSVSNTTLESETGSVQYAKLTKMDYILSGMLTNYKCQGLTLAKVIISLLKRPGMPTWFDFAALYVALTRVKNGDDFRVLFDDGDIDKVSELTPNAMLVGFLDGYDVNGKWKLHLALEHLPSALRQEVLQAHEEYKRTKNHSDSAKGARKRNAAVKRAFARYTKVSANDGSKKNIRKTRLKKNCSEVIHREMPTHSVASKMGKFSHLLFFSVSIFFYSTREKMGGGRVRNAIIMSYVLY